MSLLLLALSVSLLATGCGKEETKKTATPLCAEADDLLKDLAGDTERAELAVGVLNKAVSLCETACSDEKDESSCARLENAVTTVCANPVVCKQLCEIEGESRTKKIACKVQAGSK
jgi:hypothetical protein